jgi:hypothetical protein
MQRWDVSRFHSLQRAYWFRHCSYKKRCLVSLSKKKTGRGDQEKRYWVLDGQGPVQMLAELVHLAQPIQKSAVG